MSHSCHGCGFLWRPADVPTTGVERLPSGHDGEMICRARKVGSAGGHTPQDCDWPHCGCDPRADRVLEALAEEGWGPKPESRPKNLRGTDHPDDEALQQEQHDRDRIWCVALARGLASDTRLMQRVLDEFQRLRVEGIGELHPAAEALAMTLVAPAKGNH